MFGFMRLLRVLAPLAVVCGALFVTSCNNNNNSSSPSTPTSYPTAGSYTVTLSTASGTIPLPRISPGNAFSFNYIGSSATPFPSPFPSGGVSLNSTAQVSPPTNVPAPTSKLRGTLSKLDATVFLYVTFTVAANMPATIFAGESISLASSMPTNLPYFVEFDDITAGSVAYINTFPGGAVANSTVQFGNTSGASIATAGQFANLTFTTGHTYAVQAYYLGTPSTASPSPSPSGSSQPTAAPVVVSTTVPLGSADTVYTLPVTSGGYVASVDVPAIGTSGTSLTLAGSSQLPAGITAVGAANNLYPFYALGFTATSSVTTGSPPISLQLPLNFETGNPILAALCTATACPIDNADGAISPTTSGSVESFAANSFPGFTSIGATPIYVIFYSSRQTPAGNIASPVAIAAGAAATIPVPTITPNGATNRPYSSSVTIGGLAANTVVTVASQTGLFSGMTAVVPNTQTLFYALEITANPQTATGAPALPICGAASCTSVVLTLPAQTVADAAAASKSFYVEECTIAQCPVTTSTVDRTPLGTPTAANQLSVPASFGTDITALDPIAPVYFVFYYQ